MLFANNEFRDISIQLKWKYQFQFAGFIIAKEKGFYRDLGLDVTLKEFENGIDISSDVENQKSQFGVGDSHIILDVMRGRPFVALMPIFQQSPFVLMALRSSNIKRLNDIYNKTISINPNSNGIVIKAMLKSNNIEYIPVASDFNLQKLIKGEIDLHSGYISNEPFLLKQRGLDSIIFSPKDYGFEGYGDILYTSKEMLKREPEVVKKIYQASLKGWRYAYTNIDESIDIIYKKYNSLNKSKEELRYEAKALKSISGYGKNMGRFDINKIKSIAQLFSFMIVDRYNLNNLNDFIYNIDSKESYQNRLYPRKIDEMIEYLKLLINQKKESTHLISLGVSKNQQIKTALKEGNSTLINLKHISEDICLNSSYKNVWFQLISKDGVSLQRSWSDKRGDKIVDARLDIANMIKNPKTTKSISTGRFNISFKSMIPIFDKESNFLGIFETITQFNSISKELKKKGIEAIVLIDKKYKNQLTKAMSRRWINGYNVSNIDASTEFVDDLKNRDIVEYIEGFKNRKYQLSLDKKMIVGYLPIRDKKDRDMGHIFLYYPIDKIADINSKDSISLSLEEVEYLKEKKSLNICVHRDKMPFEDIKDDRYIGLVSEYIGLIGKNIKIPIDIVENRNNQELVEKIKEGICDIVPMATKKRSLKKYLNFSSPYIELPIITVTKDRDIFIDTLSPYQDKKWGILRGSVLIEKLKKRYPKLNIVEVSSIYDGLLLVQRGEIYGFLGLSMAVIYQIQNNFLDSLAITGRIDTRVKFVMASKVEDNMLHSILEKSLKQLDTQKRQDILNRWIKVRYKEGIDYDLIYKIIAIGSLLLLILFYRQRTLKKYNSLLEDRVEEELSKNRQNQLMLMQQSRLAQMGEMISMIAHQWRQPLNSLSVIIQTMSIKHNLNKLDNDSMKRLIKDSSTQIYQMSQTIEDFSNFFKPNKKKEYFYISQQIKKSLALLYPLLDKFDISIEFYNQEDYEIYGYPNELGQSIINIITNAKDALVENKIESKKIDITLKIENNNIILSICDNAKGIDGDIIDKIFDPYFSTKLAKNGTGLGLYMSKMIIQEQMGGILRVGNSDVGACFEIIFKNEKSRDEV